MVAKKLKLPGGEMTLVHTPYRSELRVTPARPGSVGFVKRYDYASAGLAERDFETLAAVLIEQEEASA